MLGDLHIHMVLDGVDFRRAIASHRPEPDRHAIVSVLERYAKMGISFLRDGGDAWDVSVLARILAADFGIDYRTPVFPIHLNGHYGAFIGRGFSDFEEYLRLLDEVERKKGDFVKLMISGLIDFSRADTLTEPSLEPEVICRMIAAAHERGFAVMVHANGDAAVNAALDAKVDSIEHGAFLSEETLRRLASSRALWIPTLSTIGNLLHCGRYPDEVLSPLLQAQQKKVSLVAAQGGRIGLGSDAGAFRVYHGTGAKTEYGYLKKALGEQTDRLLSKNEHYAKIHFQRHR